MLSRAIAMVRHWGRLPEPAARQRQVDEGDAVGLAVAIHLDGGAAVGGARAQEVVDVVDGRVEPDEEITEVEHVAAGLGVEVGDHVEAVEAGLGGEENVAA